MADRGWGHHNAGGDTRATISLRVGQPDSASGFYLRSPIFPDTRRIVVGQILVLPIAFVGTSYQKGQALVVWLKEQGLVFFRYFALKLAASSRVPHWIVSFPPPPALLRVRVTISMDFAAFDAFKGMKNASCDGSCSVPH